MSHLIGKVIKIQLVFLVRFALFYVESQINHQ